MPIIRTKYHHVVEMLEHPEVVYAPAKKNELAMLHTTLGSRLDIMRSFYAQAGTLPKIVVDPEALNLIMEDDAYRQTTS